MFKLFGEVIYNLLPCGFLTLGSRHSAKISCREIWELIIIFIIIITCIYYYYLFPKSVPDISLFATCVCYLSYVASTSFLLTGILNPYNLE